MSLEAAALGRTVAAAGAARVILAPISFLLEAGRVVGVTGPSGSGKTSLLRLVMGLDARSGGVVRLDGVEAPAGRPGPLRARVMMVPADPPALDVSAVALLSRWSRFRAHRGRALGGAQALLDAALGLGLTVEQAEAPLRTLSTGERRRAWFALIVALDPSFLLLDEPTAGLDPVAGRRVADLVGRLAGRGKGILLATHDEMLLARAAHHILVLFEGELHGEGAPAAVIPAACEEVRREGGRHVADGDR